MNAKIFALLFSVSTLIPGLAVAHAEATSSSRDQAQSSEIVSARSPIEAGCIWPEPTGGCSSGR